MEVIDPELIRYAAPALVRTPRLELRRDALADAEPIWRAVAASTAELLPWLDWVTPGYDLGEAVRAQRRAIEYWDAGDSFQWRLWRQSNGAFIGSIDLHTIDWDSHAAELGYWLASTAVGEGYMAEAGAAIIDVALRQLGFATLAVRCHPQNARSLATAHRLGFLTTGADPEGFVCMTHPGR